MRSKLLKKMRKYSVIELDYGFERVNESDNVKCHRIDYSITNRKGKEIYRGTKVIKTQL